MQQVNYAGITVKCGFVKLLKTNLYIHYIAGLPAIVRMIKPPLF